MDRTPRTIRRLAIVAAATALTLASGLTASAHDGHHADHNSRVSGQAVIDWNARAAQAAIACALAPANNPLHESRMYAMMHLAIHDSLNAISRRAEPYAYNARAKGAAPLAAIAAAARGTLVAAVGTLPEPFSACAATEIPAIEAYYAAALALVPDGDAKNRGVALGNAAAQAIVALRTGDGSDTPLFDATYPQGTQPGQYRFTSADLPFAFAPGWGDVTRSP